MVCECIQISDSEAKAVIAHRSFQVGQSAPFPLGGPLSRSPLKIPPFASATFWRPALEMSQSLSVPSSVKKEPTAAASCAFHACQCRERDVSSLSGCSLPRGPWPKYRAGEDIKFFQPQSISWSLPQSTTLTMAEGRRESAGERGRRWYQRFCLRTPEPMRQRRRGGARERLRGAR